MIGNTIETYKGKQYKILDKVLKANHTYYLVQELELKTITLILPNTIEKVLTVL